MWALLDLLRRNKIRLEVEGGKLYLDAPPGAVTEEIRASVRLHKVALIEYLSGLGKSGKSQQISRRSTSENDPIPLSFAQQRQWFMDQFQPGNANYNIAAAVRLKGRLDTKSLTCAFNDIVRRHQALRTTFATIDGSAVQRIAPQLDLTPAFVDLSDLPHGEREARAAWMAQDEAQTPFDLGQGPLIRASLICLDFSEHILLLSMHHIVSDGWSIGVLVKELVTLYAAHVQGQQPQLPELPIQYADFAYWQRQWLSGEVLQGQLGYWRQQLGNAPSLLALPTDRIRPAIQSYRGAIWPFEVPAHTTAALQALNQRENTTLFMTLTAVFSILLSRYSGQDDICIGTAIANRNRAEIENLIGFFVNTLVLRTHVDSHAGFDTLLRQVRDTTLGAYAHQDVPFEQLVETLNPERQLSHSPLFQVMLVLQNAPLESLELPGLQLLPVAVEHTIAKFDLTLNVLEQDGKLHATLEYNTDLFDTSTISRMARHFTRLLEAVVAEPAARVGDLPMLSQEERSQLLVQWNDTAVDYPKTATIDQLFEEQAAATPQHIALVFEEQQLSYAELNGKANQLAHYLRAAGVGPDVLVGICLERSPDMVIALLAVLKAGGAYVPLDPAYPEERLAYMLADAKPALVLTQHALREKVPADTPLHCLDTQEDQLSGYSSSNLTHNTLPSNLAYVIYTSGSTGKPKGVCVSHDAVNRLVFDTNYLPLRKNDKVAQAANSAFDATTFEVWSSLLHGCQIHIIPYEAILSPVEFSRQIREKGITTLFITTALFNQFAHFAPDAFGRMTHLLFGGEAVDPRSVHAILRHGAPKRLLHVYGPTESTTFSSWYQILHVEPDARTIPIGRPILNTQFYVLDADLNIVPQGVAGELHIAGEGLARGYLNRADLTSEKFIPHPFSSRPGARMYKTGDIVRYLADGNVEYLNRIDHQVKIRGFRIELGEVEANLFSHPGVKDAIVLAKADESGAKKLIAYVVLHAASANLTAADLRDRMRLTMPDHMVPSHFLLLEQLPLTPNGKIDREALPAPDSVRNEDRYVAPRTKGEHTLAGIWADVLKLDKVGIHDNFFELGGHSLLAITLIERMRNAAMPIDVRTLFDTPTIAALAVAALSGRIDIAVPPNGIPTPCQVITPDMLTLLQLTSADISLITDTVPGGAANIQDIYPLAPLQEGILFHYRMHQNSDAYVLPTLVRFDNRGRLDAFVDALQKVIDRHDIFRTAVLWDGLEEPVQVVLRHAPFVLEELCLEVGAGSAEEMEITAQLKARYASGQYRMDVSTAPLIRAHLVQKNDGVCFLQMLMHHLIIDHTALDVFIEEVHAILLGKEEELPPTLPFRNFVAQSKMGVDVREHESFFREMLADIDEPTAPFGFLDARGSTEINQFRRELDPGLSRNLRLHARKLGVSPASIMHLAWAQVLSSISGRRNVVFGTVLFGRMDGGAGSDRVIGLFINTLPLRIDIDERGVEHSIRETHAKLTQLIFHEQAPLAVAQRCSGVEAPTPLFSSLLNYRHSAKPASTDTGEHAWDGIEVLESAARTSYPLTVSVDDLGEGFLLTVQACKGIREALVHDYMQTALENLLEAAERQPEYAVDLIVVQPKAERNSILKQWNRVQESFLDLADSDLAIPLRAHSVIDLFTEAALGNWHRPAIDWDGHIVSYGELERLSNQAANGLIASGAVKGSVVAIFLESPAWQIVASLGALKAGCVFASLNTTYPRRRLQDIVELIAPGWIISESQCVSRWLEVSQETTSIQHLLLLDEGESAMARAAAGSVQFHNCSQQQEANPAIQLHADDPCYIYFTSGSTGKPKAVLGRTAGLAHFIQWEIVCFELTAQSRVSQLTNPSFDVYLRDVFTPLCAGATVCIPDSRVILDATALSDWVTRSAVNLIHCVPTVFRVMLDANLTAESFPALSHVLLAGEALLPADANKWINLFGDRIRLVNLYGPTETSLAKFFYRLPAIPIAEGFVPVGRPIPGAQAILLKNNLEPCGFGEPGEIHIRTPYRSLGYYAAPELNRASFIPNPFSKEQGDILYKTGDLGVMLDDGNFRLLGRKDFQVKIRGMRIEIGEIESALAAQEELREVAVLAREDHPGDKRLVAYLVARDQDRVPDTDVLRTCLLHTLPDYMVPAHFIFLERLPQTPNGKIDRKALPAPDMSRSEHGYLAPRTPTEHTLAGIWAEVLKCDKVGLHDNFFLQGGHSLLATQVISKVRNQCKIELPLRALFDAPILEAFATLADEARAEQIATALPILPVAREGVRDAERSHSQPLSFAQQRQWFIDQYQPGSANYNIAAAIRLNGSLNTTALNRAFNDIVRRHEALRTTFATIDGAAVQVIAPHLDLTPALVDLSTLPNGEREAKAAWMAQDEAQAPFNLSLGPLIRARLIRLDSGLDGNEHILLLTMHHIVSDGWSVGVLVKELAALYAAYVEGRQPSLPELPIQYADFAHWQRQWLSGEVLQGQLAYWRHHLGGAPSLLALPTDRPRPAIQSYPGAVWSFEVPAEITSALHALNQRENTTLFMTLTAVFSILLSRYSGQDDICIGTAIANRNRAEIEDLIGFFVNTLVLRTRVDSDAGFDSLLRQVRGTTLGAYAHQDVPFEQLVETLNPERQLSHSPLFQVMLVLQNAPMSALELPGLQLLPVAVEHTIAKFDLTLNVVEQDGQLVAALEYNTDLFDSGTIGRMAGHFTRLLEAVAAEPAARVGELPMLSADERSQLLVRWNDTALDYPKTATIHQLFEEQAAATPENIALVFEETQLSYADLNAKANQLAHYLRAADVGPDVLVGICVERSLEMMVALLAVLKAGGAYVPLDPAYPVERLAYMLADVRPALVLTQHALLAHLPDDGLPRFCLDAQNEALENFSCANLPGTTLPSNLAYVIYTSGSTGKPKGALLQHANVTRLFDATAEKFGFNQQDSWTLFHSYAFDFSVWEIWGALLHGGKLVIVPYAVSRSPDQFHALLAREQVTILNQTPSAFQQLIEADLRQGNRSALALRHVIFGGEALNHAALAPWFDAYGDVRPGLVNMYGITETTVHVTYLALETNVEHPSSIGRPLRDLQAYILDTHLHPVPIGVPGELYVAGDGLARGYLNRAALTAEKFVPNPYGTPGSRLYRSGDLARYLPDGNIEYLGRIDQQVKIRGFRIELGEIEAALLQMDSLDQAVVLAREDSPGDKRLVAYLVARTPDQVPEAETLRTSLLHTLPDYMVPAHFVFIDSLPLTPNGKIDRKALPAPDMTRSESGYVAPRNATEETLAHIWADVLKLDKVSVHDNFFMLGGHSLLAVSLIERMRRAGLQIDVRTLFNKPTVAELASESSIYTAVEVPVNLIPDGCSEIKPEMVTLVKLREDEIARIVHAVPGGARNIRDIYPLAPLQDGILFHHLMNPAGDAYLLRKLISVDTRERLDRLVDALQAVVNRHDILRTCVMWDGLAQPVQVVLRHAPLVMMEVELHGGEGSVSDQLSARFDPRHHRIDIRQAPLIHLFVAPDPDNKRWLLQMLTHHMVCDHTTMDLLIDELQQIQSGFYGQLPAASPFRNFIAQTAMGVPQAEHETFFRNMLHDIDESTAPFGLVDVRGDGSDIDEARLMVEPAVATRLRHRARILGFSAASIMHLAWARVLASVSGRESVVFGTVLLGRMSGNGAEHVLGMFINTLPLRIDINEQGVEQSLKNTHALLSRLLRHEHASLSLAQRSSGVAAPAPLFSSLFNYRHSLVQEDGECQQQARQAWQGIDVLASEERTNYPLTVSVDDLGDGFILSAEVQGATRADLVCRSIHTALENLLDALENAPDTPTRDMAVLASVETRRMLQQWNATESSYPRDLCVHRLFEEQAAAAPGNTAMVFETAQLSYADLNAKANRLAHYLSDAGVGPDVLVGICVERSQEMIVALLAVLKAGGAYLPLDPAYPEERLAYMLADAKPALVLTQQALLARLPVGGRPRFCLDAQHEVLARFSSDNLYCATRPDNLAYVIYTSGSTGKPKGVATTHQNIVRLVKNTNYHAINEECRVMQFAPLAFDASTFEIWGPLLHGARIVSLTPGRLSLEQIGAAITAHRIDTLWLTSALFTQMVEHQLADLKSVRHLLAGGDVLSPAHVKLFLEAAPHAVLTNGYGPTECTTFACTNPMKYVAEQSGAIPIGRPIANTQTYILDTNLMPVPQGAAGELYIAGDGLARGYLHHAALTAEKFVPNPYGTPGSRLYRSGDLARYLPDGNIEYLGRIDQQVKVRGFRIELGEIEAALLQMDSVDQAVVMAREDISGNKRLVAYLVPANQDHVPEAGELRAVLLQSLPDYMVPVHFVFLAQLPLTPNGKIDRKALPAPDEGCHAKPAYEAPDGDIEQALAAIWSDLLKVEKIGRHDNFFELGGHSLLAIQVMTRLRLEFEVDISLEHMFQNPSLTAIAEHIMNLQLAQFDAADMEAHLEQLGFAK